MENDTLTVSYRKPKPAQDRKETTGEQRRRLEEHKSFVPSRNIAEIRMRFDTTFE
jgi:hypothetical protein